MENMNKEFDISSFISEKQKELQDDWLSEEFEIKKEISYKELPLTVDEIKCICYFVDIEIKDKIKNKSELKEIVTDVGINVCKEPPGRVCHW
ncbi:MAG: hypothetical protein QW761_00625 [Candidatus Aenigmatarchaeota archaeon]